MKITKAQLKQIIKEEVSKVLVEQEYDREPDEPQISPAQEEIIGNIADPSGTDPASYENNVEAYRHFNRVRHETPEAVLWPRDMEIPHPAENPGAFKHFMDAQGLDPAGPWSPPPHRRGDS